MLEIALRQMNFSQEADLKIWTSFTLASLPRQSIGNNSERKIFFKRSLRDVESMYTDIGAYDMEYGEIKQMCRETWSEK